MAPLQPRSPTAAAKPSHAAHHTPLHVKQDPCSSIVGVGGRVSDQAQRPQRRQGSPRKRKSPEREGRVGRRTTNPLHSVRPTVQKTLPRTRRNKQSMDEEERGAKKQRWSGRVSDLHGLACAENGSAVREPVVSLPSHARFHPFFCSRLHGRLVFISLRQYWLASASRAEYLAAGEINPRLSSGRPRSWVNFAHYIEWTCTGTFS